MIYFYHKIWLILLPLSILPIVLHLLFVKKVKRIKFTYLFLIKKVLNQYLPKKRIVDIIVVILRCLIIFLIIIFLSYPVMHLSPKKKTVDLYVLLDNSFSMRQKILNYSKFEHCKECILKLLSELSEIDNLKVKIILFNDTVEVLTPQFVSINKNFLEQIKSLKPSFKNTNLVGAIEYILTEIVKKAEKNSAYKILIFTDLAEHIVENYTLSLSSLPINFANIDIGFCYPKIEQKNFYFNSVNMFYDDGFVEIKYIPENSPENKEEVISELSISNQPTDIKKVRTFELANFRFATDISKNLFGNLCLNINDTLVDDNKFYFSCKKEKQKKKVLCIINEPVYLKGFGRKKFYFENLSFPTVFLEIKTFEQEEMLLENYGAYIFVDLPNLDLIENVSDKTIIIFPGETTDIDNYSSVLDGIEFIELKEGKNNVSIGEDEEFNEFIEKFEYKNISVSKRFLITITNPALWKVLLTYNDGTPAVLNKNNIYLFSFLADKNWSNFVFKPAFVGMLKYIIEKNEKKEEKLKEYYFVGEEIEIQNVVSIKQVVGENSFESKEKYKVLVDNKLTFFVPGIYEIEEENRKQIVAININPVESKIAIVNQSMLKKIFSQFKNVNITLFDIKEMKIKSLIQWILGKDVSHDIIYLVVILFILETILSRLGKRMV